MHPLAWRSRLDSAAFDSVKVDGNYGNLYGTNIAIMDYCAGELDGLECGYMYKIFLIALSILTGGCAGIQLHALI